MKIKRFLAALLMLCLILSVQVVAVSAAEVTSGTCGEHVNWSYDKETATLTISGSGAMEDYNNQNMPSWYEAKYPIEKVVVESGVTRIGSFAFGGIQTLKEAVLPNTVTTIGSQAFVQCANLKTVNLPESLTTIEGFVFSECGSLTGIELPEGLESIGDCAFHRCKSITALTIPGSLKRLSDYTFSSCSSLKELNFEEGFEVVSDGAFVSCGALTSVVFPTSLKSIGYESFFDCSSLNELYFQGDAPSINDGAFFEVVATAYYPAGNTTWTEAVRKDYGGTLTWITKNYNITRISGTDRCKTAIEAAKVLKDVLQTQSFDAVILASGNDFADALAGSYLAKIKNAPILLYTKSGMPLNAEYIRENLSTGGTVYILGGTAAVPASAEEALKGIQTKRLYGTSRFETNLKILEEAGVTGGEILVATGYNYADSLSASAVGLPILMVNNDTGALTDGQKVFLEKLQDVRFTIVGGNAAVSDALAGALGKFGNVDRVYGTSREATSVKVAEKYFTKPDYALLTYSWNFPDGLCGGPLACALGAPLILTNSGSEAAAAAYVAANGISKGAVLGGFAAVSDETTEIVFNLKK